MSEVTRLVARRTAWLRDASGRWSLPAEAQRSNVEVCGDRGRVTRSFYPVCDIAASWAVDGSDAML